MEDEMGTPEGMTMALGIIQAQRIMAQRRMDELVMVDMNTIRAHGAIGAWNALVNLENTFRNVMHDPMLAAKAMETPEVLS
jgi:hypothetical protein